jgi:hypothetical protein
MCLISLICSWGQLRYIGAGKADLKKVKIKKPRGKPFAPGDDSRRAAGFKPGESGNPDGYAKNPFPKLIREATDNGGELVNGVLEIFRKSKSEKLKMWAAEWLRDTGWHKPVQGLRSMDEDGNDAPLAIVYER